MMNKFISGEMVGGGAANSAFAFDQMRHELGNVQQRIPGANQWAADFAGASSSTASPLPQQHHQNLSHTNVGDARWSTEFGAQKHQAATAAVQQQHQFHAGLGYMPQISQIHTPMMMHSTAQQPGKIVELDNQNWEEQFKQIEQDAKNKEVESATKSEESVSAEEVPVMASEEAAADATFERIFETLKTSMANQDEWAYPGTEETAWERDFDQYTTSRPDFGAYQFEENNKFKNETDPFTIGVQLMESGGNLSDAALAFEAAVQRDPEHVEAWSRLGAVQAQNERESASISALERCIELDPGNLSALMNLSVSYTNEGYENAAYSTLEKWIATKYPQIVEQARAENPKLGGRNSYELHARVTELFIRAAQLSPDGANMDASVQDGLGILFYSNEEYSKAIDCFKAAIAVRPNDALLWNRLGATLANSNRSEESIEAYSRALELRPLFVRARYNLGVACINIGCFHEAAQHLLSALSLHQKEEAGAADGPVPLAEKSSNLLSTLKRVFLGMDRRDLYEKVKPTMDLNSFREEFDF
ncbi:hypothetical protein D0Z03_002407 [Geotrichum reessii]|nr:hypothetical protein D0Z03_002407 [Galactomyces reessii]